MELLIASNNSGKVHEIKSFLQNLNIKIYSLEDWKLKKQLSLPIPDPDENGSSYYENALIKAKACYDWGGIPCLADDTGLEVEVLNNEPGLYTARYAGINATFADNISKIKRELASFTNRSAKFRACLVFFDGKEQVCFNGEIFGEILVEERGTGGFGYDPIFQPSGRNLTFAELKVLEPEFLTHRIQALVKFKEFLLASKLRKVQ